jgi:hypothetical protein
VEREPALRAPVFVMLREHGQLWPVLDSLEQQLSATGNSATGNSAEALALCRQLTVLLVHRGPEGRAGHLPTIR